MRSVPNFTSKEVELDIDHYQGILPVAHALSTELRLQIIRLISNRGMSVNEIARELDVPLSTTALNVQVLEKAGLITCDTQPGVRGTLKLCDRRIDRLTLRLDRATESEQRLESFSMPVGGYSVAGDIRPTCGLATVEGSSHMDDSPAAFYHPIRFKAGLIWMREGFVEYRFPNGGLAASDMEYLEFSFEACSEAPCYRNEWPSNIGVSVNGHRLGAWECPGDFGGRRGLLNPDWWVDANSQYGRLVTWRVNQRCTTLENTFISSITLKELLLEEQDFVTLRIGVEKHGDAYGGMNLFGESFGDFPQGIVMRCMLREKNGK